MQVLSVSAFGNARCAWFSCFSAAFTRSFGFRWTTLFFMGFAPRLADILVLRTCDSAHNARLAFHGRRMGFNNAIS
jgi:hypothetical protein